jgi:hypothetical protein
MLASWLQIGLAVLPGLAILLANRGSVDAWNVRNPKLPEVVVGVLLVTAPIVVSLLWKRELAPWAFPAVGVSFSLLLPGLFGLLFPPTRENSAVYNLLVNGWLLAQAGVSVLLIVLYRREIRMSRLGWVLVGLLVVAVVVNGWTAPSLIAFELGMFAAPVAFGLLFARRHHLLAGLVPVTLMYWWADSVFDPSYSNRFGVRIEWLLALFFLVVTPAWVLVARSTRGQLMGLLMPPAFALVYGEILASQGSYVPYSLDMWVTRGLGVVEIMLVLSVAALIYRGFGEHRNADASVVATSVVQAV